jgi:hypothetical protein
VKLADGLTGLVRKLVMLDAFRQLIRALALPRSPLRRRLGSHKTNAHGMGLPEGRRL